MQIQFINWNLKTRLKILKKINIEYLLNKENNTLEIKNILQIEEKEILYFICNPLYKIDFLQIKNKNILNELIQIHSEFWHWKIKQAYVNIEKLIPNCIIDFLIETDCKNQDQYFLATPIELKNLVLNKQEILTNIINTIVHDEKISWIKITQLILEGK